ncbi:hypothetical protein V6N11_018698 [Hibiscus sabdariffa]|uniref:Uncharacterized protein n=1 Tax=Hibiscus sabdariffa TaxID=183260 RepID=A0ABR2QTK6_9ROSI
MGCAATPSLGGICGTKTRRLRLGISDVFICMNFAYLHISSVYDLSYEVEAPKNVFGSLMCSGFLCLRNGSIVVTIEL